MQNLFLTIEQLSEKYPAFSTRYLRRLLANRKTNGIDIAVITITRGKLVIDEEKFLAWINQHREVSENE